MKVTMQAQKEMPPDMQCKDKFLVQGVVATPGIAAKDITQEMVILICFIFFTICVRMHALHINTFMYYV